MATIIEVVGSREQVVSREDPSYPLKFQVFGDDCFDDAVVRAKVEATIPAYVGTMVYQRYQLHDKGAGNWDVDVYYGRKYPRTPGSLYIHFDYTTEKVRTFTSLSSQYFPALKDPNQVRPDGGYASSDFQSSINFFNAINVKDSGNKRRVEGVEVEDPAFSFTITRLFGPIFPLTQTFISNLKSLRGRVNSDVVKFKVLVGQGVPQGFTPSTPGPPATNSPMTPPAQPSVATTQDPIEFIFQPGELQFHGATGGIDEDTYQEIVLRFSSYENIDFINDFVPNCAGIPNVVKKGFQYLWVAYDENQDSVPGGSGVGGAGGSNRMVPMPRQVNIEDVYRSSPLMPLFS